MNYEEFCAQIKTRVQEVKGEGVCVCVQKSLKNNGQEFTSLMIKDNQSEVVPALYLEGFYRQYECGNCFEDVLEKILAVYEDCRWQETMDFSFFFEFEQAKNRIVYKLINRKDNETFLKKVPWFPVLDLAMVFYCLLPKEMEMKANIPINHEHLHLWNVEAEDLYEAALSNTPKLLPFWIEPICNVLKQLVVESSGKIKEELLKKLDDNISELTEEKNVMYVLSNKNKFFGAACFLYPEVLKNFSNGQGKNLFILPSSVHEVLLIPDDGGFNVQELRNLVREVNRTQVEREEQLSGSVYYYSVETGTVMLARAGK